MSVRRSAVVVGVGARAGLGTALARRFAREGLRVFITGLTEEKLACVAAEIRNTGGEAETVVTDATVEKEVIALFNKATSANGALEVVAYNVGANIPAPLSNTNVELFESLWQQNCFGGFLVGRETVKHMTPRQRGTFFHWRNRLPTRQTAFHCLCLRQGRTSRPRPRDGKRIWAARYPCHPCGHRWRYRWGAR